ncbi:MAG TPA: YcxB family protein [Chitinophagaceae bacterium]|nr:YcxB family protein [Chitinophagaceae bacterium]
MSIQFQYNKQAVIKALRFHFKQRPEIKIFRTLIILVVIAAFVGYFTHFLSFNALIWIFIAFVALIFFLQYMLPLSVYRRAHTFREPQLSLDFTEDYIVIGTDRGKSRIPWQQFNNVIETRDFFYLYRSNRSFFLIPANAFDAREDRIKFSEKLQQRFSNYLFK